jgi:hypothetical protein
MEGEHELTVTHISREGQQTVEASESALFNIQAMVITEVTVVPGAIGFINIAAPAQRAISIARLQVLPEVLQQAEATRYSLLRMDTALPAGTVITEDVQDDGQHGDITTFEMEEDGYLFFLDLDPGAYFEHPVRYMVVQENGESKVFEAKWWPRVNNEVPEPFVSAVPLLKNVVERNVTLVKPAVTVIDWRINPGLIQLLKTEAFICVQGLTPGEGLYSDAVATYENGYDFFDAYKPASAALVGLTDYDADNVLNEINTLAANGYDIITIYIIAHGGVDYIKLGGVYMWASEFANTMAANPGVQFNFLLGSCHGGSFVDNLAAVSNVRVVKTACLTAESAYGDKDNIGGTIDFNTADTGSEWTSSILRAADTIASTAALWTIVSNTASLYNVSKTSVMLNEAGYLAVALNRGLPVGLANWDLTDRVGWSTPDHYASWEVLP